MAQNCVQRDRHPLEILAAVGERRGPKNLALRQIEQAQLNGADPALAEPDLDQVVARFLRLVFARRIDREHGQRAGLRQTGGDVGAQFGDQLAPGRGRVARRMRRNDHARQFVVTQAQARRVHRPFRRPIGGRAPLNARLTGRTTAGAGRSSARISWMGSRWRRYWSARVDVAAFLIGLDQCAIGDLLARIDFQNARGGDDRRLFDRAVRLRLNIGRQRRQEFGAQSLARSRASQLVESFAMGSQSGE